MNGASTSSFASGPRPRSMDLSPRRAGVSAPISAPKPASAVHTRATHVIDLRASGATVAHHPPAISHEPNHTPAPTPKSTAKEHHIAQFTDRFDHAKRFSRSEHISRFGPDVNEMYDKFGNKTLAALQSHAEITADATTAPAHTAEHHSVLAPTSHMPQLTATQHAAMAKLAPSDPRPANPPASTWTPGLSVSPRGGRVLASVAAVAIMAGYVWVQNYPKLAIQSASGRAGITASLPGFVPSSYSLKDTQTNPGLVTLSFASPSSPESLTIAQHRTTWDSSSLLDNFVSKQADDYATVQGQGLTIYLFNNNHASWVNHGIWYSIEGASRLSREQILKIAYSL